MSNAMVANVPTLTIRIPRDVRPTMHWHPLVVLLFYELQNTNGTWQENFFFTQMITHGHAPFLECSSRGDKRFSAFYAKVNGKSIEEQYQAFKVFADGSSGLHWKQAKSRRPINLKECAEYYSELWNQYIQEHPDLLIVLKSASGVSDRFGQPGHVCQATELWRIRNS